MKLVDANVLLYAVNNAETRHEVSKAWLDGAMAGHETVLFPWICLLAFLRLATHPAVFPHPLSRGDALDIVDQWLAQPNALTPQPDRNHAPLLRKLLAATGRGGNLVNDAHIAALAIQHRAVVITFDNDFARFPGVSWEQPS